MNGSSNLRQIIYLSSADRYIDPGMLQAIAATAASENPKNDITGMLLHIDGSFMQVIEGPPEAVGQLMEKISKDPRHRSVRKVSDTRIEKRSFGAWSMGTFNVDPATLREGVLFKLSADEISGIAREIDSSKVRVFLESFYDVHVGVRSRTPVSAA